MEKEVGHVGTRFYRRIKILPGVTINLSKSGASLSLGPRGARITLSKKGTRKTVGIPGTGLSYTDYEKHAKAHPAPAASVGKGDRYDASDAGPPNYYLDRVFRVFLKKGIASWIPKALTVGAVWFFLVLPLATADQPQAVVWGMVGIGLVLNTLMLVLGLVYPPMVWQPNRGAVAEVFLFYLVALIVGPIVLLSLFS